VRTSWIFFVPWAYTPPENSISNVTCRRRRGLEDGGEAPDCGDYRRIGSPEMSYRQRLGWHGARVGLLARGVDGLEAAKREIGGLAEAHL